MFGKLLIHVISTQYSIVINKTYGILYNIWYNQEGVNMHLKFKSATQGPILQFIINAFQITKPLDSN